MSGSLGWSLEDRGVFVVGGAGLLVVVDFVCVRMESERRSVQLDKTRLLESWAWALSSTELRSQPRDIGGLYYSQHCCSLQSLSISLNHSTGLVTSLSFQTILTLRLDPM